MAITAPDTAYMDIALGLARRGLGLVAPNPAVGCVIVRDGRIIGRGFTQAGGRPHAETEALAQAGAAARGATAYVTLEPCSHTGKTGPCAQALIDAGIGRVVSALEDADSRVSGRGHAMLAAVGIQVDVGIRASEAEAINRGFFLKIREKRPLYTLKVASSQDGRIALAGGDSKWISGPEARSYGHLMRARHDAILVGIGTVLADNPMLDCRLPGLENRSPIRAVLDRGLRTPLTSKLVKSAGKCRLLIFCEHGHSGKAQMLTEAGAEVVALENLSDLKSVSLALVERDITRVLVEGGGRVHASFIKAGLADRVAHFVAPKLIGADGIAMIGELGLASLGQSPHLTLKGIRPLGADILASYEKAE